MTLMKLTDKHRDYVHHLRSQAEEWLRSRGIDQYNVGPRAAAAHADIDAMMDRHEFVGWFVGNDPDPVAVLALTNPDPDFWTPIEMQEDQGYISRFLVREHGTGYGAQLLDATAHQCAAAGSRFLRLDCWKTNTKLHAYYQRHGFHHVRTVDAEGRMSGALFQRDLPYADRRI